MSKFNRKSEGTRTENLAGGMAYKESTKLEFISILLTSFVESQFYRSNNDTLKRLDELIRSFKDKLFCAKAAIYARTKFGMRSITHVTSGIIANSVKGESWTKNFFEKVIYRVDDVTETLSYYFNTYGKPLPNALKKGLSNAFSKFDRYQLSKYKAENKDISLVDAVNLLHPKPNDKNDNALKDLINGNLKSEGTWESELTLAGQKANNEGEKEEFKKEVWIKLIKERKIGYFALLRNLRNILQQAPDIIDDACNMLIDEKLIKKSLVLPFRHTVALDELKQINGSQKILVALNKAVDIALQNVPKFKGKTLVVLDVSGSMDGKPAQIGSLFSAILVKSNECDFMKFSDNAEYEVINPLDSTITIANSMRFSCGRTNFHAIFQKADKSYDRIIILSDMQGWVGYNTPVDDFNQYKKRYNCDPFIYSFDLQGYGSLQFPENKILCLAGFSDKILDIMALLEEDKNALINEIEKIEL